VTDLESDIGVLASAGACLLDTSSGYRPIAGLLFLILIGVLNWNPSDFSISSIEYE
jgi:hypothetical protein